MKRTSKVIAIVLVVAVSLAGILALSGCGKKTLESISKENTKVKNVIDTATKVVQTTTGVTVEIKENQVLINYDLRSMYPEDNALASKVADDAFKKELETKIDNTRTTFQPMIKTVEALAELEGVEVVQTYSYANQAVVSKTITNNN